MNRFSVTYSCLNLFLYVSEWEFLDVIYFLSLQIFNANQERTLLFYSDDLVQLFKNIFDTLDQLDELLLYVQTIVPSLAG